MSELCAPPGVFLCRRCALCSAAAARTAQLPARLTRSRRAVDPHEAPPARAQLGGRSEGDIDVPGRIDRCPQRLHDYRLDHRRGVTAQSSCASRTEPVYLS